MMLSSLCAVLRSLSVRQHSNKYEVCGHLVIRLFAKHPISSQEGELLSVYRCAREREDGKLQQTRFGMYP